MDLWQDVSPVASSFSFESLPTRTFTRAKGGDSRRPTFPQRLYLPFFPSVSYSLKYIMPGSQPPFPLTSTVTPPLSLPYPNRPLPPPRPPRLRPASRSSSVLTDPNGRNSTPNPEIWTDVTLATFFDSQDKILPSAHKDYIRGSFIDMYNDALDAESPTFRGTDTPPTPAKQSSEQTIKSAYTNGSAPVSGRSKLKSVGLVLSCAGAMIINVSLWRSGSPQAVIDFLWSVDCEWHCRFHRPSHHRERFGDRGRSIAVARLYLFPHSSTSFRAL